MELESYLPAVVFSEQEFFTLANRVQVAARSSVVQQVDPSLILGRFSSIYVLAAFVAQVLSDYQYCILDSQRCSDRSLVKQSLQRQRDVKMLRNFKSAGIFVSKCLAWLCPDQPPALYDVSISSTDDQVPWALIMLLIVYAGM